MPLPGVRSGNPSLYLPSYRSAAGSSGYNSALSAYARLGGARTAYGEFDPGQIVKAEQGGLTANANQIINWAVKQPAYAFEAPLRPVDTATGGLLGNVVKGVEDVVGHIPVLSNILGGLGEGLKFTDQVAGSIPNHQTAADLAWSIGKQDNELMPVMHNTGDPREGVQETVGDFRKRIASMWGVDQEGNQYSLAELEARARDNAWNFGGFSTSENPGSDFLTRMLLNPLNLLLIPGAVTAPVRVAAAGAEALRSTELAAAGARYLEGASRAAEWARPLSKPVTALGNISYKYGYGYAKSLGRGIQVAMREAHNPNPFAAEFKDVISSARDVMNGGLREQGTMKSVLTAVGQYSRGARVVARKIYFPGIDTNLTGARLVGSATRAWMRGGIQQELVGGAAEGLFGNIQNYLDENNMNHTFVGELAGKFHDMLSELNNDHPLSDSNAFVMATLFMPTFGAARDIPADIAGGIMRPIRGGNYYNRVARDLVTRLNDQLGAGIASKEELFTRLGGGDVARGEQVFLWMVDKYEVLKSENQLSHLTHAVADAEIDGLAVRNAFVGDIVRTNVLRRRTTGALQPGSTADYMLEQHFGQGKVPKRQASITETKAGKPIRKVVPEKGLASEITGTHESFIRENAGLFRAYEELAPQLQGLGADITRGGILDRETMDAIIAHVEKTPEGLISRDLARQVIDMGNSLVYEPGFWREFALSLGQEPHGGVGSKALTAAEGVSKADLLDALGQVRDAIPSQQELFHEILRGSKAQGVAKNDVFRIKEPPYPMGAKLKANRAKSYEDVSLLADNERALSEMRNTEYFKSGKPKFGAASQIVGPEGTLFKRIEPMKPVPPVAPKEVMEDDMIRLSSDGLFAKGVEDVPPSAAPTGDLLKEYKAGPPNTVRVVKKALWPGRDEAVAIWHGPDGEPKGYAQVIYSKKGRPTGLSVYVEPEFRRRGVATRLYEELQKEGIDIGRISGTTVTAEGRAFAEAYRASRPSAPVYRGANGIDVRIDKGVVNINIPAGREAELMAQLDKTIFKSGPRKGTIKPGMEVESAALNLKIEAARLGIDTEALVLAAQNNGRVLIADRAAGPLLADYGFVESSTIRDTTKAAYSYRGGAPSDLIANHEAHAFAEYRPVKREAHYEKGAIGIARRDAINASMFVPSTHYLGKAGKTTKTLFPEERLRFLKEQTDATRALYKQRLKSMAEIDEAAFKMLPFDRKITDMALTDWFDHASKAEVDRMSEFLSGSFKNYPSLSLEPNAAHVIVDPTDTRFGMLVTHQNRLRQMLIDYGPMSPIQRIYDAIIGGKHVRWLGKQTQREFHNLLASVGVEPNASREYVQRLRKEILESRAVRGFGAMTGTHEFGSFAALPEEKLRAIANDIFPNQANAVLERWGDYQKMLTEASNRLLRTVQRAERSGASVSPVAAAADAAFRTYQYSPELGLDRISYSAQRLTKYWYPRLRFQVDPLFAVMNYIEPYMYNVFNQGWRGLRDISEGERRRIELASAGSVPPGGLFSKAVPDDLLMADPGFFTAPKNIRVAMEPNIANVTQFKAEQYFEAMAKDHPVAQLLRERFGDNIKDWAAEMNRMMESMVEKGPENFVRSEFKKTLEDELGYSQAELKQFAPVAERLTEVYRGVYNDMADLYIGRMNRSNLERFANNFFITWPISYMMKVVPWMYRILAEKIGPVPGSAGAYLWDQYRQKYEDAVQKNPAFRSWTEDNQDFLFALELVMPVTPVNVGITLSKSTRYVGSWVSPEIFGQYDVKPGDIPSVVEGGTKFGPIRTWNLVKRTLDSWEVPGFYQPPTFQTPAAPY